MFTRSPTIATFVILVLVPRVKRLEAEVNSWTPEMDLGSGCPAPDPSPLHPENEDLMSTLTILLKIFLQRPDRPSQKGFSAFIVPIGSRGRFEPFDPASHGLRNRP